MARGEHRRRGRGALLVKEEDLLPCWDANVRLGVMYLTAVDAASAEPTDGLGDLRDAVRRYDPSSSFVLAVAGPLGLTVLIRPWPGSPQAN